MANLTFNGQRLLFPGGGILDYTQPQGITGLAIWNGLTDSVQFASYPTITGSKGASLYMTIDPDMPEPPNGGPANAFLFGVGTGNELFGIGAYKSGSNFYLATHVNTQVGGSKRTQDISSFVGEEIFIEVTKETLNTLSISINGNSQTLSSYSDFQYSNNYKYIGPYIFTISPPVDNILVRDIKLYDDPSGTNTLIHHWIGYPAGNTDAAWVDQAGSLDGTITGSPGVTT